MKNTHPDSPESAALDSTEASSNGATPRRRRREELEQLAAEFVNSRLYRRRPLPLRQRRRRAPQVVGLGLALAVAVTWLLWPADDGVPARETAVAAPDAEALARQLEARRARERQRLQQSRELSERMAAADRARLREASVSATPPRAQPEPARADSLAAAVPAASRLEPAAAPAPQPETEVAAVDCDIHVSELSASGTLTYAQVAGMRGARFDASTGHVFMPPVVVADGRTVTFEVMPNGCVRISRQPAGR